MQRHTRAALVTALFGFLIIHSFWQLGLLFISFPSFHQKARGGKLMSLCYFQVAPPAVNKHLIFVRLMLSAQQLPIKVGLLALSQTFLVSTYWIC